jgi:hypothetical protein
MQTLTKLHLGGNNIDGNGKQYVKDRLKNNPGIKLMIW